MFYELLSIGQSQHGFRLGKTRERTDFIHRADYTWVHSLYRIFHDRISTGWQDVIEMTEQQQQQQQQQQRRRRRRRRRR